MYVGIRQRLEHRSADSEDRSSTSVFPRKKRNVMSFTNMPIDTDDDQNLPTKTILNGHVCDTVPLLLSHGAVSFGALRKELEICTGANFGALQGTVDGLVTAFPPSAVGLTRCPPPPHL